MKKLGLIGLLLATSSCGPSYERATIQDLGRYPSQYVGKYIEVQGQECGLSGNQMELFAGKAYISSFVSGEFQASAHLRQRVSDEIIEELRDYDNEPIIARGKFNREYELEIKELIVNGKKFKF